MRKTGSYHVINTPFVTGRQLIELEKKQPIDKFDVFAFFSNQPKPKKVGLDEEFDLRQKCLVRFVLQPKEQQDGRGNRKDFSLPQEDVDFLNGLGLHWETVRAGGLWLIIYGYPIPEGYNVTVAEVALMIAPNYPASEIDMVYFYPQLQKKSGKGINAITPQPIDGRIFQRWSRHRKRGEWRPGIDDISTHLALVENWILKDLNR